jgi:AcrR family transcriptional regulator
MTAAAHTPKRGPKRASRPLRADAERNRLRLLDVAQEVFAEEGLDVPIDAIARRAGLGVGTLYRHFPTKEALFEAIVVGRIAELAGHARAAASAPDAGAALFAFLERMVSESGKKKDFLEALAGAGADMKRIGAAKKEMKAALTALLERAQEAGAVRRDVDTSDVFILVMGAANAIDRHGRGPEARRRVLGLIFDGLRAHTGRGR